MRYAIALLCVLGLAGCRTAGFDFDSNGWGGPGLKYTADQHGNIQLYSGMLVNRDFRWAEGEFSFEFLDSRDLVWGIRLMDETFQKARRDALADTRIGVGKNRYIKGRDLPASEMWKVDTVLEAVLKLDTTRQAYKMLDTDWVETFIDKEDKNVSAGGMLSALVSPDRWNVLHVSVSKGKLTYSVNGVEEKPLQLDARTNGRMGIFVVRGGPLRVRNVRFSRP